MQLMLFMIFFDKSHPEMIEKSFSVCRITTHDQQEARNDEFLRSIVQNVNEKNS